MPAAGAEDGHVNNADKTESRSRRLGLWFSSGVNCCTVGPKRTVELCSELPVPTRPVNPGTLVPCSPPPRTVKWARALDGTEYMPGLVGLNNMKVCVCVGVGVCVCVGASQTHEGGGPSTT